MSVKVVNLQSNGRGGGLTPADLTFQDPLTAGVGFYIGPNWGVEITFRSTTMTGDLLDQALNTGAGGMTFGSVNNLNLGFAQCFPVPVNNRAIIARSSTRGQYAQFRFKLKSGALNAIIEIAVMGNAGESGYAIQLQNLDGGTCALVRHNGNFMASTVLVAALTTYVVNDVLRLEARVIGATVELRSFKNGILVNTFVDNTGSRLTSGRAGMFLLGQSVNSSMSVDNYDGGSL